MKRGFLVLLTVIVAGLGSAFLTRHFLQGPPSMWLCKEYGLSQEDAEKLELLRTQYRSRCSPSCEALCNANAHLEKLVLGSCCVTPELQSAVVETDKIRSRTRIAMLEYFYVVAEKLPAERRKDYLLTVLPLLFESSGSL